MENLKVMGIKIENFMCITGLDIEVNGADLVIAGKNGNGKTSLLSAVWAAVLGRVGKLDDPIKKGEEKGRVSINLGEIVVSRTFTESNKGGHLTVTNADGYKAPGAQGLLDTLVGKIAIDPHKFMAMTDKDQVAALLAIAPVDMDLPQHEAKRQLCFSTRTDVNREVKRLEGAIFSMGAVDLAVPNTETPVTDILKRRTIAEAIIRENDGHRRELEGLRDSVGGIKSTGLQEEKAFQTEILGLDEEIGEAEKTIISCQSEIKAVEGRMAIAITSVVDKITEVTKRGEVLAATVAELVDPDLSGFDAELANNEEENKKVRLAAGHRSLTYSCELQRGEADKLTDALAEMDKFKDAKLKEAKIPAEGLGLGDGMLIYNGTPFKQASHAEQISVATALLIAQDPIVKLITISDASLMDEDSWLQVKKMGDVHGYQMFTEIVANSPEQMAIYIGDDDKGVFMENGAVTNLKG